MDDCVFEAYVTNLGKYNEGALVGEWVKFPTTPEEMQEVFKRIGINAQYEEYFITDYDMDIHGLYDQLGEYESLDKSALMLFWSPGWIFPVMDWLPISI